MSEENPIDMMRPRSPHFVIRSDHSRLTNAGWAYRVNGSGNWIAYRDPETGLWHAKADAVNILRSRTNGSCEGD